MEGKTDSNGIVTFVLGENNYTIKIFRDYLIFRI